MDIKIISQEQFDQLIAKIMTMNSSIKALHNKADEWLNSEGVCKLFKISTKTLQAYRDRKIITFYQTGAVIRYRRSEVERDFQRYKIGAKYSLK